ncbi:hypothetical protein PENSPDRAFT_418968 [Peniophora sp. CONT]|nr:hypothetical protein PENSPDRAFT_418968 [Peniophora sp. CONT]
MTSVAIPPTPKDSLGLARKPRTIVLCFDGTSNEYGTENTNVVKFYSLLKKDRTNEQICYYQPGIGTYFQPGVVSPILHWWAAGLDMAIAWYLSQHVLDGYKFLMQNYNVGDKVCIFGFSRGAYTARALAGMLHKIGLLLKDNDAQLSFAYKLYKSEDPDSVPLAMGFKRTFCRPVPIEFIGVWDTVASVGVLTRRSLPFVTTNTTIKTFRHALALDERRARFRASYYHRPTDQAVQAPMSRADTMMRDARSRWKRVFHREKGRSLKVVHRMINDHQLPDANDDAIFTTNVKEVWFAGCHGDVGGGSTPDTDDFALSDIPLRWMVREAMQAQCGLIFDNSELTRNNIPLSIANIFELHPSKGMQRTLHDFEAPGHVNVEHSPASDTENEGASGSSTSEVQQTAQSEREVLEIQQPIHDELKRKPLWWLLEVLPTKYTWQRSSSNQWAAEWSIHLGEGRGIPDNAHPLFHESVRRRMQDTNCKYKPRAKYEDGTEEYVD